MRISLAVAVDCVVFVACLLTLEAPLRAAQAPASPAPPTASTAPGLPGAPPRDTSARGPAAATGTAVLRGRVVALDTGLPLRRARVRLFMSGQPRATTTDADGAFTFRQVAAGQVHLSASKARYVDASLGPARTSWRRPPLTVAEGQTIEGLVLALPPAGVITGRVMDDAGEPVTGVEVIPMRFRTVDGERQLTAFGRGRSTDDTGTFRLFGLSPGKYYLSAQAEEARQFGNELAEPDVTGFAPTFYPGTPLATEAQAVELVAGTEIVADLQLVTARLTTVSGIVVDQAGVPASGGYMMLSGNSHGGGRFGSSGGSIKPDGTFVMSGIAPGEYEIVAQPSFGSAALFEAFPNGPERRRSASVPIVANGTPIAGLRLVVQDPIRIPVDVTFEDGGADRPQGAFVSADGVRGMSHDRAVMRDGRLALEVLPGTYRLTAGAIMSGGQAAATPWFVKRISYRGRAVEDDEVELTGEPGGRVDVVFTTRSSTVSGSVTDAAGKPAAEFMVIIVPEEAPADQRAALRRFRIATPEAEGRFRAEHLRPGAYVAAAVADAPMEDLQDVDFLAGIRRIGKPLTVTEGASTTLTLTLTPLP